MEGFESTGSVESTTESVTTSSPASSTPAIQSVASTPSASPATSASAQTTGAPVAPSAYTPNYKYKVMDKEHEIPEFLRGAITDTEKEKQIKELYEKAMGLDVVKPKYQTVKQQYDRVIQEKQNQDKSIEVLGSFVQKNDLDSFFKALKIPEEQVFEFVQQRLQYRELAPEQRRQIDMQRSEQQRMEHLEMQHQQLQERYFNDTVQARTYQLDTALEKPEVREIAEAFDARVGTSGAFKTEVIKRGQLAHYTTGADIPVAQAVTEVLSMYRPLMGSAASGQQMGASAMGAKNAPPAPPVIPNITGRQTSPAKRVPKSLDELRALAKA